VLLLLLLFSVYLFSYSFCIHYHSPLCILTCYYCFLVTKDDLVLSLFHTVRESLSTSHTSQTTLSSMYFFPLLLFSLSLFSYPYVDSYLLRIVQERKSDTTSQRSAWINFFILSSMYVCVCSSSYEYEVFSLHIINFPLLYSIL